jgi:predicted regulator of Ras-like GTPase activity (Roadblock/LC7/MglB family)
MLAKRTWLDLASREIQYLQGVVIAQIPDCIAWESWENYKFDSHEIAAYFGDMVKAQRNACQSLAKNTDDIQLSIESNKQTILVSELTDNFIAIFIFNKDIPLGMARFESRYLSTLILENLPTENVVTRSHADRVIDFIQRYAPDPYSVLMRISLQTKIPYDKLKKPNTLSDKEIKNIELSAKSILGVTELNI